MEGEAFNKKGKIYCDPFINDKLEIVEFHEDLDLSIYKPHEELRKNIENNINFIEDLFKLNEQSSVYNAVHFCYYFYLPDYNPYFFTYSDNEKNKET